MFFKIFNYKFIIYYIIYEQFCVCSQDLLIAKAIYSEGEWPTHYVICI